MQRKQFMIRMSDKEREEAGKQADSYGFTSIADLIRFALKYLKEKKQ